MYGLSESRSRYPGPPFGTLVTVKSDDATTVLRRAIRQGVFRPGDDLIQEKIATTLDISRVPLREALRGLVAVGIVQLTPGRGFRVTRLAPNEIAELYDLRLQIEPAQSESIVAEASPLQIADLADLERQMRATTDQERWANLNYEFHRDMYAITGKAHAMRIIGQLLDLVEPYSRLYVHELDNLDRVQTEHATMVEALRSGHAETLAAEIDLHLRSARDELLAAMEAQEQAEDDPLQRLIGLGSSTTTS